MLLLNECIREFPNDAYTTPCQNLLGCSTLSREYCKLIGLFSKIKSRQLWTLTCRNCIWGFTALPAVCGLIDAPKPYSPVIEVVLLCLFRHVFRNKCHSTQYSTKWHVKMHCCSVKILVFHFQSVRFKLAVLGYVYQFVLNSAFHPHRDWTS